jgi:biotin carboxylase
MKRTARSGGIPCADFARIGARTSASSLIQRLGLPMVIKPVDSSGSRGTVHARTYTEVEDNLGPKLLAEAYVHGLEMSVESFVMDGRVLFANPTEYVLPLWANVVPAELSPSALASVLELNQRVITAFQIQRGMTHLELFLTAGGPVFGEIALRPPGGYLMDLLERAYGFDPWRTLIELELGQTPLLPEAPQQVSGVWIIHPGQGRVRRIAGCEQASRVSGVDLVECNVEVGAVLGAREGSGQSVGRIVASGASRQQVVNSLQVARRCVVVDVDARHSQQGTKRGPKAA